jgi:DNA modification methylase
MQLTESEISRLIGAVCSSDIVSGYTHDFYKYPARFSPDFARVAIDIFTEPGDLILDPFMGGATTIVEARLAGRRCIGSDVNELSPFIAKTKTQLLLNKDFEEICKWALSLKDKINLHNPPIRATEWIEKGYQRNINSRKTWPTRKTIELILAHLGELPKKSQRMFVRCTLMRTAQWAVDCTTKIPSAREFRKQFISNIFEQKKGALEFAKVVREIDKRHEANQKWRTVCLNRSAVGLEDEPIIKNNPAPKLILTSPPYPGVHILYHRWQIHGRRETPAPYWIANANDGHGSSFYTFGGRKQKDNRKYFDVLADVYKSLSKIADDNTTLVQMVGFSNPDIQLSRYIRIMEESGFKEIIFNSAISSQDGRLWRSVPNRKWYAANRRSGGSSKEVVLFHKLNS